MKNYKQFSIYLSEDVIKEIKTMVDLRNTRIILDNEERKVRSVEEFIKGSVIQTIKWLKSEELSAGMDDLGKPYRLRNRFKEIAEKKHLKGKDLSELTNIRPSNISYILANRNQPSLDYFLRIWIALGCPPLNECLYRDTNEMEHDD